MQSALLRAPPHCQILWRFPGKKKSAYPGPIPELLRRGYSHCGAVGVVSQRLLDSSQYSSVADEDYELPFLYISLDYLNVAYVEM